MKRILHVFAAVLPLLSLPGVVNANPSGAQVVSGTANIQQIGNLLQITNSQNAIINWNSFSIAASEITQFNQPSAASAVLNRVVGQNPSSILGALQSNGRVFLINPSGIVFGASAQIDVAGLVASTLNLSDQDFLAGRLRFTGTPGAGAVVNQGAINGSGAGVYLVGPSVTNGGVITNPQGEVILAAGRSVELINPGTPNLSVQINAPDNEALNLGQIIAASGRIGIYAGLIRTSGTLNADRAVSGPAGEILLKATANVVLEGGTISAAGGAVVIEAGQNITVQNGSVIGDQVTLSTTTQTSSLGGSVCLTIGQGCGGLSSLPSIVIVGSGSGTIAVSGGAITLVNQSGPAQANLTAIVAAFANAGRVFQQGTGQIVGSFLSTSQINDLPLGIGSAFGTLTPARASLLFE
jgi:filamentous hemagglutinin family protein